MSPRVLCVEDDFETREFMSLLLTNYDVTFVISRAEAVQKAREDGFALILMDIYLIDGSGVDACTEIRTFDKKTPILFFTGDSNFTETSALEIGAQGAVHKATKDFVPELDRRVREFVQSAAHASNSH
jgi:CheY-like chemotaxis protein